ncbi:unnamed protein product, partial [Amoebophrya sp. A25]
TNLSTQFCIRFPIPSPNGATTFSKPKTFSAETLGRLLEWLIVLQKNGAYIDPP